MSHCSTTGVPLSTEVCRRDATGSPRPPAAAVAAADIDFAQHAVVAVAGGVGPLGRQGCIVDNTPLLSTRDHIHFRFHHKNTLPRTLSIYYIIRY